MELSSEDLPRHLARGLAPLYVIYGDAPLLAIESADAIRSAARIKGYNERETFIVDQHFKWDELKNSTRSLSLFSERKIIDLRIPSGKPGLEGGKALQQFASNLCDDILTLISFPKLDWATQSSQWFLALKQHGVLIAANDIPRAALPRWIASRLKRQEQSTTEEAEEFLADRCEGNLLAAFQEIQKLALLFPAGRLSFEQVESAVLNVARYDISKLSDAMLDGDAARFSHILEGLCAEGTATVLVLWKITEDLRTLGKLHLAVLGGANIGNAMRDLRIHKAKQKLFENAHRRLKFLQIEKALRQAAQIDKLIKGLRSGDIWNELLQLGVRCARSGKA